MKIVDFFIFLKMLHWKSSWNFISFEKKTKKKCYFSEFLINAMNIRRGKWKNKQNSRKKTKTHFLEALFFEKCEKKNKSGRNKGAPPYGPRLVRLAFEKLFFTFQKLVARVVEFRGGPLFLPDFFCFTFHLVKCNWHLAQAFKLQEFFVSQSVAGKTFQPRCPIEKRERFVCIVCCSFRIMAGVGNLVFPMGLRSKGI